MHIGHCLFCDNCFRIIVRAVETVEIGCKACRIGENELLLSVSHSSSNASSVDGLFLGYEVLHLLYVDSIWLNSLRTPLDSITDETWVLATHTQSTFIR